MFAFFAPSTLHPQSSILVFSSSRPLRAVAPSRLPATARAQKTGGTEPVNASSSRAHRVPIPVNTGLTPCQHRSPIQKPRQFPLDLALFLQIVARNSSSV